MAGLLSNPPLLRPLKLNPQSHSTSPPFLSLSSFLESTLFGLGLRLRIKLRHPPLSLSSSGPVILSRFGAYKSDDDDDDVALNLSSVRSDKVRLIDEQQNMVGIVSKSDAIRRAMDAELDLVVVSLDADPPVVRVMNYDKYRYEQQKKKKEQQKKSAASRMDLKELKMGYNIDVHDYSVRLKAAQRFLKDGDKVKVIVLLKGKGKAKGRVPPDQGIELIKRFQEDLGELATEEGNNFSRRKEDITERFVYTILLPNKAILQKTQEASKEAKSKGSSITKEVSAGI